MTLLNDEILSYVGKTSATELACDPVEGGAVREDLALLSAYMLVHEAYLASSIYLEPYAPRSRQRPFVRPK